jgi:hypothetical protein
MNKSIHQSWPNHTHVVFQQWGAQRFAVEVDSEGVRVYEVHASGPKENERIGVQDREVWIDPHEMTNEFEKRDILLVHAYVSRDEGSPNDEGVPVTLSLDVCDIVLTNDGNGTLLANKDISITEKKEL